jgi:hypothetical protein
MKPTERLNEIVSEYKENPGYSTKVTPTLRLCAELAQEIITSRELLERAVENALVGSWIGTDDMRAWLRDYDALKAGEK